MTGHITAGELPAWFDTLATLFDARVDAEKSAATRSRLRDPGHFALADIALRRAVLGTAPVNPEARISLDSVVDRGAVVAIVADVDPVAMEQLLSNVRSAPYYEAPLDNPASTIPAPDSLPPVLEVPYPVAGLRSVTVSSIRFGAPSESLDPAAYVALTSFGSYHGSRLVRRIARLSGTCQNVWVRGVLGT